MKLSELSWSPNAHKLTLAFGVLYFAVQHFGPYFSLPAGLLDDVLGFLAMVGMVIKTAHEPPAKADAVPKLPPIGDAP